LEVWEKVFLKNTKFLDSTHGKVGCVICHGGNSTAEDKDTAHQAIIIDPSDNGCNTCHEDIALLNETSLHTTLSGFTTKLEARGGDMTEGSSLHTAYGNHCQQCHTSCGQCHISRPDELGGGFLSSHNFRKTPSMQNNCVACHGSRVGDEYLGGNEGVPADIHWTQETMTCTACHGQELHGSGVMVDDRYSNTASASCEDCHEDVLANTAAIPQHEQHIEDLECQVCHSLTYKNCYGCHIALDEEGLPCRTTEPAELLFEIGLNPIKSQERPYKYVVLRHAPTCVGTCDFYGENLFPEFDNMPTWKYATPHNIQLHTPQNESCNSCHGNTDIFLTENDVDPAEREANRGVIVIQAPATQ